jgi:hypothetical protein
MHVAGPGRRDHCARPLDRTSPFGLSKMTFRYSFTFPIAGPNKLPRFKDWSAEHAPEIEVSLPPQVPVKSEALTIRLKSAADRQKLMTKLADAKL